MIHCVRMTNEPDRANVLRCGWATTALSIQYHDTEWGVPVHDDCRLFEFLILEGAQAGLSWETILKKRGNYRKAFANFDAHAVARFDQTRRAQLLSDAGIVRNRLKIDAAIANAKAFLRVQAECGSFAALIGRFATGPEREQVRLDLQHVPAQTEDSLAMSKELRRRGFKFVGATICYAFMQAVGLVNDHVADCFRRGEIDAMNQR